MSIYEFGPFQLDGEKLLLLCGGEPVALGPKVVETLLALLEHPGEVLTKSDLLDRIWPNGFVEESNLSQNIHVLRKAFADHGYPAAIETIPRRGYRFSAPLRKAPSQREGVSFALNGRIAAALAGIAFAIASLVLIATPDPSNQRAALPQALSVNGAQLYAIGEYYWNRRTREGVRKSLLYFAQVVDSDPRSALGYAALADANVAMGDYCYGTHLPDVYFARADAYARRALALDPNSVQARASLGYLALNRKQVGAAVITLKRAVEIDPTYAPAQEWYGIALLDRGDAAQGVLHLRIAAHLDPLSVATTAWLGSAAYRQRRFGDAIAYGRQALELSPQRTDVLETIGKAYEAQGRLDRAIAAFKRYAAVGAYYRPAAAALLAHAYALAHRASESRTQFTYARTHPGEHHTTVYA